MIKKFTHCCVNEGVCECVCVCGVGAILGDGEGADLSGVGVVFPVKRCVHGEFAAEDQLALPSVACERAHTRVRTHTHTYSR